MVQRISITPKKLASANSLDDTVSSTFRTPPSLEEDAVSVSEIDVVPSVNGFASIKMLRWSLLDIQAHEIRYFLRMVPRFPANFDEL